MVISFVWFDFIYEGSRDGRATCRAAARGPGLTPRAWTLLLQAPSAQAIIAFPPHGAPISYLPPRAVASLYAFDEALSNVEYNGGMVMRSNNNYAFYWDPSGAASYPTTYKEGVNDFFSYLAHDSGGHENVDSVIAQYGDYEGEYASYRSTFAGEIADSEPYPANGCAFAAVCLTNEQVATAVKSLVEAHSLPRGYESEYFVLLPPGVEVCFSAQGECSYGSTKPVFCAYHSATGTAAEPIIYAVDPYVYGDSSCASSYDPSGNPYAESILQGGLVHEHDESLSDPWPPTGWADLSSGALSEVGDKCRGGSFEKEIGTVLGTAPDGSPYNQVIDGHYYYFQQEWSNIGSKCMQRIPATGQEAVATFTSKPVSGDEMSFDAEGSFMPGGVTHYVWQFGEGSLDLAPNNWTSDLHPIPWTTDLHPIPWTTLARVRRPVSVCRDCHIHSA